MNDIVVFGSINMDVINHVHQHPLPGETIKGLRCEYSPGGKGANQAVAASLSGSTVRMVGAVGSDGFGDQLIQSLNTYKVNTDYVLKKESTSGLAFITVDDYGQNNIILSEGANGLLSPEDVEICISALEKANIVLLQNEIPWETTRFVIQKAKEKNITVFFNPAPAFQIPNEVFQLIDVLILNETEAESITGISVINMSSAEHVTEILLEKGVHEVILTLGDQGLLYNNREDARIHIPAFSVKVTDTTAAGDTFIGAFATSYSSAISIVDKLKFASAAAALTVTKSGAQNSIPSEREIQLFLDQQMAK